MTFWGKIRERMLLHPEKKVKEGNASMTFEEMVVLAEYYATGFPKVPYMGIFCESEMAMAIGILSCFAAGIPAIPIPVRYGKDLCLKIIERAEIPLLFTDQKAPYQLIELRKEVHKTVPDDIVAILFTSGSSGFPKGVMLSDKNLLSNIDSISSYFPISDNDKV